MLSLRNIRNFALKLKIYPFRTCVQEATIKIDKYNINYLKVGSGPHNVLCLPGALGTIWTDFEPQINEFDRDKYTLIVWDPPGYGKSRPPMRCFSSDMYENDAHIASQFMQALQIPRYSILGWSGGGLSGLIHAAKYPEATNKLVVWGSPSFILERDIETYQCIRDIDKWSDQMREPFLKIYGRELLKLYWSQWGDMMLDLFQSGNICSDILKDVKCPTLVLVGEKDPMCAPEHARHLVKNIANSRLHAYPKGKHNVHINYAEDFNYRVQNFLQEPLSAHETDPQIG